MMPTETDTLATASPEGFHASPAGASTSPASSVPISDRAYPRRCPESSGSEFSLRRIRGAATGLVIGILLLAMTACGSPDYDRLERYYAHEPKTILVLPARNMTTDAEAPRFFMATIPKPLVDRGYYVYPPHLTADLLAREGIDLEGQSWGIEPDRLKRYLGADAVLYVTLHDWDTNYAVLSSAVEVDIEYVLVDSRTGAVIWRDRGARRVSGGGNVRQGGIVGLFVSAVDAAVTAAATDYVPLARQVNSAVLATLPPGGYHPEYAALREAMRKAKSEKEGDAQDDTKSGDDGVSDDNETSGGEEGSGDGENSEPETNLQPRPEA